MKPHFCFVCLLAGAWPAYAANWATAPSSRLEFVASFEKAPAPGRFKTFDLRTNFDPTRLATSRIDIDIQADSADMGSTDINLAIAQPEWFDFTHHRRAEFHATELTQGRDATHFIAHGTLKLKGVEQRVNVPFQWVASGDQATMDGSIRLQRNTFGIGTGEWAATDTVGAEVEVKFHIQLRKAP